MLCVWPMVACMGKAVAQCSTMLLATAIWCSCIQLHEVNLLMVLCVRSVCHTTDDAAMRCVRCAARAWSHTRVGQLLDSPKLWQEPMLFKHC